MQKNGLTTAAINSDNINNKNTDTKIGIFKSRKQKLEEKRHPGHVRRQTMEIT